MNGLVLTRRSGERILFRDGSGHIGTLTIVAAELNRVSIQLEFGKHIRIERAEVAQKGRQLDKRA
jgi:sRNA-binding carbon storage regulator CsrA